VYRLYSVANQAVRKRKKVRRPTKERIPLQSAATINEVWSMDLVSDSLANDRRLKCLTVSDDFSHECVDNAVGCGISGEYVTRLLDRAAVFRGYPSAARTDNGPEFRSRAFMAWPQGHRVRQFLIAPGRPTQNGYIESFNGKFREECLNEHWFQTQHRRARPSRHGAKTTTRSGPTAASVASHQRASPSSIADDAAQNPPKLIQFT
jgi:putative transposase